MYQICSNEDEFEPRIIPKPAPKPDSFTVPSVPEVSLIFDKPSGNKTIEHVGFQSPPITITRNNNSLNTNGSYAAWKQQNYSYKPSNNTDSRNSPKSQFSRNYDAQFCSTKSTIRESPKESKGNNHGLIKDTSNCISFEERGAQRRRNSNSYEHSYQVCENNIAQYKNTMQQCDHMSSVSNAVRPCIGTDNYDFNQKECFPLLYEKQLITNNSKQVPFNDSTNESTIQNQHINPNMLQRSEYQLPHYLGQQYPYFNMNSYPFPQFHPYSPHNTDNQETMKNLLQIINSQNDQIKSLQIQVDRLLKMQEENLKERKKCSCSHPVQQQNNQFLANSNDTDHATLSKSTKTNLCQNELPKDRRKDSCNDKDSMNQSELILAEAQAKKTFMEQKVSIGVMTSFEFTVQNSPFTVDIDDCEKPDSPQKNENLKLCNSVGICDNNESLKRYKNSFTRMPSGQLENIVEDSESYMSSSQQQSSNLNATTSTRDLEKQVYIDAQKETDGFRSESPKLCRNMTTNLNQAEDSTQKNLKMTYTEEMRNYDVVKTQATQMNIGNTEYNVLENRNSKANTPTDRYKKLRTKKDNDFAKTSNSVNSSDSYKDYRREGKVSVTKGVNCVEDSLILNGGDLKINERPPPTPEPSIHVDMNEYSSDEDSEKVKRSSKVGWTFYNNVLGQVNQLLQNSCVIDDQQQNHTKVNQTERNEIENKAVLDTVKNATLEQLKKLGISLNENPEVKELNKSNKVAFDLSFYPRLDYQTNMTQATSAVNETNTSMHMKALALKYLTDEQLAELAVQKQGSTSLKHLMVSNVQGTNMSFATMRYLERYQLLPGKNNAQAEDINKVAVETPSKNDLKVPNSKNSPKILQRFPFNQTPKTSCPSKILDISTLKQQPKLL